MTRFKIGKVKIDANAQSDQLCFTTCNLMLSRSLCFAVPKVFKNNVLLAETSFSMGAIGIIIDNYSLEGELCK